jgi:peptide/nickel transport system substrate-binding protein
MKLRKALYILPVLMLVILTGCQNKKSGTSGDVVTELQQWDTAGAVTGDWIIVREMADAEKLNPVVTNDASASQIDELMYEGLNNLNYETYELIPWVGSLPEVSPDHLQYTYKLRNDVKFADGKPLTGEDIIFTMKCIKNPFADAAALRNYFDMVTSAELVNGDPYTVRFYLKVPYWRALYSIGTFLIMPKHILDPNNLTDKYNWDELNDMKVAEKNSSIRQYADFLNSQEVSREPRYVFGSGPYKLDKWKTGETIEIKRNPDYWGNSFAPAYPDKIIFRIIQDNAASVVATKNKEVDMMYVIKPDDFYKEFSNSQEFNLLKSTPSEPVYSYIGWNNKNPLFADKKVRMALSHLIDRKSIIEKIYYNNAYPIQSHVFFKDKKYLNAELPEIPFDMEKGKQMLNEAGWVDSDGNGILDKVIDGKKTDFRFTFLNNNNPVRKQIVLIFIDALKKVGIVADVQDLEWSVYLDKTKKHEFEATLAAWQLGVTPPDPFQIWHSSQAEGEGSNYISYINAESDKILEEYRQEFDEAKRIELMKRWQKIIYDEQPYTFLWSPTSRYVYDVRFKNTRWYARGNSPILSEWWVPKGTQKYSMQ